VGRPARIDRSAVLTASLELADEEGLPAVTMQAVAGRLGVTPMALYRYVANKADLLDGVVERILWEVALPDPGLPWADRLALLARGLRAAALRHPRVFPLLLQRPAVTSGAVRTREAVYGALREAGADEPDVVQLERVLSSAVLGFAASEAGGRFAAHSPRQLDADFQLLQDTLALAIARAVHEAVGR
jgi:AcrR family transcriptional regulator